MHTHRLLTHAPLGILPYSHHFPCTPTPNTGSMHRPLLQSHPRPPVPQTPPVLPETSLAHVSHNTPNSPHSHTRSTTENILLAQRSPWGPPSFPPSLQTWLEPTSRPQVRLPIPNARTWGRSVPQACAPRSPPNAGNSSAPLSTLAPTLPSPGGDLSALHDPRGRGLRALRLHSPPGSPLSAQAAARGGGDRGSGTASGLRPPQRQGMGP